MSERMPLLRPIRCPRCRTAPAALYEAVHGWEHYEVRDGHAYPLGPSGEHGGSVEADCACGHRWKLRGVRQITEVIGEGVKVYFDADGHEVTP